MGFLRRYRNRIIFDTALFLIGFTIAIVIQPQPVGISIVTKAKTKKAAPRKKLLGEFPKALAPPKAKGRAPLDLRQIVGDTQPLIIRPGEYAGGLPPIKPRVAESSVPDLSTYGPTGTPIISGFVEELGEYNSELSGRNGLVVYEKMRRSDADVAAILAACKLPIRGAEFKVIPGIKENEPGFDLAKEIAEDVEDNLFGGLEYENSLGMKFTQRWEEVIENALLCMDFGCSGYEDIWKIDGNKVRLTKMAPRLPLTFYRFHVEEDGETLKSVEQWGYRGNQFVNVAVPSDKFTLFSLNKEGSNFYGRALALDTPVPTPDGWKTMGDLNVGDEVFDEQGMVQEVTAVANWKNRPCYKVTFDDSESIVADENHEWLTHTFNDRAQRKEPSLKTTKQIAGTVLHHNSKQEDSATCSNHSIPCAKPLEYPEKELAIDPYVLGLWLGNGDGAYSRIAFHANDVQWFADDLVDLDYDVAVGHNGSVGGLGRVITVFGLITQIKGLGLFKNKHVPSDYLFGSVAQRLRLLAGLMDSDGSVNADGQCSFSNANPLLIRSVIDLVRSLGVIPTVVPLPMAYRVQPAWEVRFAPNFIVFRLPRKAEKLELIIEQKKFIRKVRHYITSVERVRSRETKCIEVSGTSHLFLVGEGLCPTHNSLLRSAYQHWYIKNGLYRIESIACERNGAGVPTIIMGPTGSLEDKQAATNWVNNLAAHESTSMVLPNGWTFDLVSVKGRPKDMEPPIKHHSEMICRSVLAMFMTLGSSSSGSRALGSTMVDFFQLSEEAAGKFICDTISDNTIRRYVDFNYPSKKDMPYPRLAIPNITTLNPLDMMGAIKDIATSNVDLIQPDDDTENWFRRKVGMPTKSKEPRVRYAPVTQKVQETATDPTALEHDAGDAPLTPEQEQAGNKQPVGSPGKQKAQRDQQQQQDKNNPQAPKLPKIQPTVPGQNPQGQKGVVPTVPSNPALPKQSMSELLGGGPGSGGNEAEFVALAEPRRPLRSEEQHHDFEGHVKRADSTAVSIRRLLGAKKPELIADASQRALALEPEHLSTLNLPFDRNLAARIEKATSIAHDYGYSQVYAERYRATGKSKKEQPHAVLLSHRLHNRKQWHGLDVSIENEKGTLRSGTDKNGNDWSQLISVPYGYIRMSHKSRPEEHVGKPSTIGNDEDHIDCYLGNDSTAQFVYIVHQNDPDTKAYDEDKVILNASNEATAKQIYMSNHGRSEEAFGFMTTMTVREFKQALEDGHGQLKLKQSKETLAEKSASQDRPGLIAKAAVSDLNNSITARAKASHIDNYKKGLRDVDLGDAIASDMFDGSDSVLDRIAGEAARSAVAGGRYAAFEELADEISSYARSEAMDQNTCDACEEGDGNEWDTLDDVDWSPGDDCEGADMCRGQLMPIFADEGTVELQRETIPLKETALTVKPYEPQNEKSKEINVSDVLMLIERAITGTKPEININMPEMKAPSFADIKIPDIKIDIDTGHQLFERMLSEQNKENATLIQNTLGAFRESIATAIEDLRNGQISLTEVLAEKTVASEGKQQELSEKTENQISTAVQSLRDGLSGLAGKQNDVQQLLTEEVERLKNALKSKPEASSFDTLLTEFRRQSQESQEKTEKEIAQLSAKVGKKRKVIKKVHRDAEGKITHVTETEE